MYYVGGAKFYNESDSKDTLIDAFISTRRHYYARTTGSEIPLDLSDDDMFRDIAEHIYEQSPDALAFAINQETIYDTQLVYEKHWMDFLWTSLKFKSCIVKVDCTKVYGLLRDNNPACLNKYHEFLTSINGAAYLVINERSEIVNDKNQSLILSEQLIGAIGKVFLDTSQHNGCLYIKYAPAMDTGGIFILTRILHLYL